MGQLAKLFIRGSLVNVTAKNLTTEQKQQVEDLMFKAWDDPNLDSAKTEFCSILRRTIGNEYADREYALAEAWITFWRTAVDVLFHNKKTIVVENHIVRRKHFKTCLYMYMRQILNENKIPTCHVDKIITGSADTVSQELLEFYLQNNTPKKIQYTVDESGDHTVIHVDTRLIPLKTMSKICDARDEFEEHGIKIIIDNSSIQITVENPGFMTKKVSQKQRMRSNSMSGLDENDTGNNFQQHCEYQAVNKMEVEMDTMLAADTIKTLTERLTEDSQKVFSLMIDPPKEFLDQYYPRRKKEVRPKEIHIAQWLGVSKDEVSKCIDMIQKQAIALDIA